MDRRGIIIGSLFAVVGVGGSAVLAAVTATPAPHTGYLFWGGIVVSAIAGFRLWQLFHQPESSPIQPQRDFIDPEITWDVLTRKIEGKTKLQIDRITETYAGKWIRVCGRVRDVADSGNYFSVDVREDDADPPSSVRGHFSPTWAGRLSALNKGDWLCMVGQIKWLNAGGTMGNCELEHVGEPPSAARKLSPAKPDIKKAR